MPRKPPRKFEMIPGVVYFMTPNLPPKFWETVRRWRVTRKLTARQVIIIALTHLANHLEKNEGHAENACAWVKETYPEGTYATPAKETWS